jgi:type VI secretion system protein ImpL
LQAQWEEKVLADTQGAASLQKTQMLLAPEGPVWKFVKGPAAPFIGWNVGRGYHAKEIYGSGVPLEGQFLAFLGKGAKVAQSVPGGGGGKTNYTVAVKGFPIDANPDARIKPHGSRIELQCVTGPQTLINHNYPVAKTFTWSPDTCTDVVFQIEAGDVVITKRYTGEQAFPEFIHDFPGGSRTFQVSEFPNERRRLEQMGIKNIKVHYSFSGQQDMLKQVRTLPGNAPRGIAKCWDR